MTPLTKDQTRIVAALRKGTNESLTPLSDEKQQQKFLTFKAVDVVTLLDLIDAAYGPTPAAPVAS